MNKNKVIWHEGLFLRPQHFQQQDRFLQHWIEQRCQGLIPYSWGITDIDIDHHALSLGKVSINYCRGIFPDGTPFEIPDTTPPPEALTVTDEIKNSHIYLALPITQNNTLEVASPESKYHALSRYHTQDLSLKDWHTENLDSEADLQVGTLNIKLLTDQDKQHGFVTIPLVQVIERNNEDEVKLNPNFITSTLHCQASPSLMAFIKEIQGLLKHRSETLAHRIANPSSNGLAEITDFLLLHTINRAENTFRHLISLDHLHPETFYRAALELAGELATFTCKDRRAITLPHYIHHDLQACFIPVMDEIRRALSFVNEQRAIPIELTLRKFGVWVGIFKDKSLLDSAMFVL
ncbi:MAG TPA: type VI secretion system baseplate subunit TssK, partial [Thiothrix sp.]|nr:type VI secretion system baseplate subunit TssK [Thiothrix sp.]